MERSEVEALLELAEKATPGPWRQSFNGYSVKAIDAVIVEVPGATEPATAERWERWMDNSEFIATARTALPALCRALLAAQEELATLRPLVALVGMYDLGHALPRDLVRRCREAGENP